MSQETIDNAGKKELKLQALFEYYIAVYVGTREFH